MTILTKGNCKEGILFWLCFVKGVGGHLSHVRIDEAKELLPRLFPRDHYAVPLRWQERGLSSLVSAGLTQKSRIHVIGSPDLRFLAPTALFHSRWAAATTNQVDVITNGGRYCLVSRCWRH